MYEICTLYITVIPINANSIASLAKRYQLYNPKI